MLMSCFQFDHDLSVQQVVGKLLCGRNRKDFPIPKGKGKHKEEKKKFLPCFGGRIISSHVMSWDELVSVASTTGRWSGMFGWGYNGTRHLHLGQETGTELRVIIRTCFPGWREYNPPTVSTDKLKRNN